ncbi:MAG: ATP-binding protein [Novosphingobium sp.]
MAETRPRGNWKRRTSLTVRILAVNIIALALMAGSLFYLDSYRKQLFQERFKLARAEAEIAAAGLATATPDARKALLVRVGQAQKLRLRLYGADGRLALDSFALAPPSFTLVDPDSEGWYERGGRLIDGWMQLVLGTQTSEPYADPEQDSVSAWPELGLAARTRSSVIEARAARDETPMINAATPIGSGGELLLSTRNARDITQSVRDARGTLAIVVALTLLLSIQLSLFLARTIVQPLRALVRAAVRVRLGRDRSVEVPRLPERGDEIGLLARALSDMSGALRQRIDAVESFAADVAHEIKNPLASLRSALESLDKVQDEGLRGELAAIAAHDVQRIDRLVSEISEASRIDAELSRTQFEPVNLRVLVQGLVKARDERGENNPAQVLITSTGGPCDVLGDEAQLVRVLENLLDNAVSFSPADGEVLVSLGREDDRVVLAVLDQGPGIPASERAKVFDRFHSLRPAGEAFGNHSGLGLAIARTIAEAHEGTLTASDRPDGKPGACLVLSLPAMAEEEDE